MKIVCGIDEAGYGPPLGPLVVSASIFETKLQDGDGVRDALARVTADSPSGARGRLVLCDSKKLHSGANRLRKLERNLLPFVAAAHDIAEHFREVAGPSGRAAAECPWYAGQTTSVPREHEANAMVEKGAALREELGALGVRMLGLEYRVRHAGAFNRDLALIGNKSYVSFGLVAELLDVAWRHADRAPVEVWVDKQGGRDYYGDLLRQVFLGATVSPVLEGAMESAYVVERDGRHMTVRFAQGAEERHKTVALASMCSKYVREVFMERFNAWWQARVPGLRSTRGYYTDAGRFLREIEDCRLREGVPMDLLVRQK